MSENPCLRCNTRIMADQGCCTNMDVGFGMKTVTVKGHTINVCSQLFFTKSGHPRCGIHAERPAICKEWDCEIILDNRADNDEDEGDNGLIMMTAIWDL